MIETLVWLRYTIAVLALVVVIVLSGMFIYYYKELDMGRKLWTLASIFGLIYIADACREAAEIGLGFKLRIIPVALSLMFYFAYLLEPETRKRERFKKNIFD